MSKKLVLYLVSGTMISQGLTILASPLLTRLYSPTAYGEYAVYAGITTILSVFFACRYEFSLIEAEKPEDANALLFGCVRLTSISLTLSLFIILITFISIRGIFYENTSFLLAFLIPFSAFSTTNYVIFLNWLNRNKNIKGMNLSRIINAFFIVIFSILFSSSTFGTKGLIIGNLFGQFCAITFQWFKYIKKELKNKRSPILQTLKKYKHYPKYLIPGTSAGTLANEAPTFLLSKLFDASYAGFFSLVNRLTSPLSIVISAITEVYNVNAVRLYRENGECKSLYLQTIRNLASITIFPCLILLFWGPTIFTFVFGDQWTQAGVIARYFSFLIFFQSISTPLSYTITLNQSQKYDMFLQFFRLGGAISAVFIGFIKKDVLLVFKVYSLAYSLYYIFHILIQYRAAIGSKNNDK